MLKTVLLALTTIVVVVFFWLAVIGVEPQDRRPGTRLAGTPAPVPETWASLDDIQEVHIETHPWWGVPFSVTVVMARDGDSGVLYSPSIYSEPAEFPGSKFWNRIIADNPEVRVPIGGSLYGMTVTPAADAAERQRGLRALAAKYPFWQKALEDPTQGPAFVILRVEPR